MKTAIKICIIALLSYGCDGMTSKPPEQEISNAWSQKANQQILEIKDNNFEIIEIQDCEYIIYKKTHSTQRGIALMAHKGNCKNPIHCYN